MPHRAIWKVSVEQQLDRIKITKQTSRQEAKDLVRKSLVQPSADETSLELVTGLYFSPESTARFRTTTGSDCVRRCGPPKSTLRPLRTPPR